LENPREALALWNVQSSKPADKPADNLESTRAKMEKCFSGQRPSHLFATPEESSWAMWREQPTIRSVAQVIAFNGAVKQRCCKLAEAVYIISGRDLTWVVCVPPEHPTGIAVANPIHKLIDLTEAAPTIPNQQLDALFGNTPATPNIRYQFRDIVPKQYTPPFFTSGLVDHYAPEGEMFDEAHLTCDTSSYLTTTGWKKVEARGRESSVFLELYKLQTAIKARGGHADAYMLGDGTALFKGKDTATTEEIWLSLTKCMMNVPSQATQKSTRVEKPRKTAVSEPDTTESTIVIAATSDITPAIAAVLLPLIFGETPSTAAATNTTTTTTTTTINGTTTSTTHAPYKVVSATRRTWRIKTSSEVAKKWRFVNLGAHVTVYAENWNAAWETELRAELRAELRRELELESSPLSSSSQIIIPQSPHQQAATSV
jgi:hypothetical protein